MKRAIKQSTDKKYRIYLLLQIKFSNFYSEVTFLSDSCQSNQLIVKYGSVYNRNQKCDNSVVISEALLQLHAQS